VPARILGQYLQNARGGGKPGVEHVRRDHLASAVQAAKVGTDAVERRPTVGATV
jgi:hypothetical protein